MPVPEVHGLEVNPWAAALGRGRLAHALKAGLDRDAIWQAPKRNDVMPLFEVLEHGNARVLSLLLPRQLEDALDLLFAVATGPALTVAALEGSTGS